MPNSIQITTPSRLHFTLIDLNAELGRVDGGIGVTLNRPGWDISVEVTDKQPEYTERVAEVFNSLSRYFQMKNKYQIVINKNVPRHVGLGSQTQLALALARAVSIFEDQSEVPIRSLARYVGRGGTSGVGVAAFEQGGFILDGGHSSVNKPDFLPSHYSEADPAVVLARYPVPEDWYFVIAVPNVEHGAHGTREAEIFQEHCPLPTIEVEKVARVILMQTLPSVLENDIESFGRSLTQLQKMGFKRVENELQFEVIPKLQEFYLENGAFGTGLSSFGPATYGVVEGESAATKLTGAVQKFLEEEGARGEVFYSAGNNSGAEVNTLR
jgi:beta-ribofuranosylaminobenzene 5'-phosphate synthase